MFSCNCAGYGVFATQDISKGEFLLEYCGELINPVDADALEDQTYVYYFSIGSKMFWFVCYFIKTILIMYCGLIG